MSVQFSVVMPTYNVALYLKKSVGCIKRQTYHDWELIIVDDGSTDGSGELADQEACEREASGGAEDAFAAGAIRVIHQPENRGVSEARNIGMAAAKGDYILFLDPDDWYEETLLERLAEAIDEGDPDILVYGLYEEYYKTKMAEEPYYTKIHTLPCGDKAVCLVTDPAEIHGVVRYLESETMLGYPWNKAYRLSYLWEQQVTYPKITHVEDILFNLPAFQHCSKLVIIETPFYHYRNSGQVRLTGKYLPEYFSYQKKRIGEGIKQQRVWEESENSGVQRSGKESTVEPQQALPDTAVHIPSYMPYDTYYDYMARYYFRSFLSMMERDIEAKIPKKDTLAKAEAEKETDLYRFAVARLLRNEGQAPAGGKTAQLLFVPLAKGAFQTAYSRAKLIYHIKHLAPGLYAKLKQSR